MTRRKVEFVERSCGQTEDGQVTDPARMSTRFSTGSTLRTGSGPDREDRRDHPLPEGHPYSPTVLDTYRLARFSSTTAGPENRQEEEVTGHRPADIESGPRRPLPSFRKKKRHILKNGRSS